MGSTKHEQVTRILLMAFGLAVGTAVSGARQPAAVPAAGPASGPTAATEQPAPAAVVTPPAEAPVTPPKVVCTGNELTISANNSTLSSVLQEVHRCMGTRIDIPDAAGAKRIFDKIGPGPASQVLDLLLSNTGYNYIIGASPSDDDKIVSIMLLARATDGNAPVVPDDGRAGSVSRRAFMQMHQAAIPHPMTDADNAAAAELNAATDSKPTPAAVDPAPDGATPTPAPDGQQPASGNPADPSQKPADSTTPAQPDATPTPAPAATPSNSFSTRPATTEQQIVNMQQMFELRKQLNQQQNQNANPPQP